MREVWTNGGDVVRMDAFRRAVRMRGESEEYSGQCQRECMGVIWARGFKWYVKTAKFFLCGGRRRGRLERKLMKMLEVSAFFFPDSIWETRNVNAGNLDDRRR